MESHKEIIYRDRIAIGPGCLLIDSKVNGSSIIAYRPPVSQTRDGFHRIGMKGYQSHFDVIPVLRPKAVIRILSDRADRRWKGEP